MHNNRKRMQILVSFFLFVFESITLAVASPGGGLWGIGTAGERQSSFLGMLGNVIGRAQKNNQFDNFGSSRSLPYTRLSLDDWTKTKSSSITIDNIKSAKSVDGRVVETTRTTPRETLAKNGNDSLFSHWRHRGPRRVVEENFSFGEEYDACCHASLSATVERKTDVAAMTSPIVPLTISFDGQTGEEFADAGTIDRLVASGLEMATQEKSDWVEWKLHSSTKKLLEENNNDEMAILEQGEVMVYVGKSKREGHGSNLPIIKTKSLLPLAAEEMAELLMDSSRVKIYNKMSVGRTDVRTLGERTKVVCNLTKPPIAKSNMVSCTMMHSRRLQQGGDSNSSYLVVSRATPGMVDDAMSDLPRNDILLGINLLEDRAPNECIMTAVTHIYSPALPTILAKKMGVSSAINFVKDIRSSCESVSR
jgi:hypothetical protein